MASERARKTSSSSGRKAPAEPSRAQPPELKPKQAAFVREYLKDSNATQAAIRAGYEVGTLPPSSGFYVYILCDPRGGRIFYVGKGKGRRMLSHARDARRLDATNPRKTARILEILEAGHQVDARVFAAGLEEGDAFALERALIEALGKDSLTNHSSGVVTPEEHAKVLLSRVKPFEDWAAETRASEEDRKLYGDIVHELQRIAGGSLRNLPPGVSFVS